MAGMIYRPVREKSIPTIMSLAEKSLARTGYEELALASLSSGDYTGIQELMKLLMATYRHKKVAVSFPS
ncbi:MAG: B12-binding domain-containing radical SAM protein, partial [Pseudomonadota bacterium]